MIKVVELEHKLNSRSLKNNGLGKEVRTWRWPSLWVFVSAVLQTVHPFAHRQALHSKKLSTFNLKAEATSAVYVNFSTSVGRRLIL